MPYWCAARLQPHREALALNYLAVAGYETYYPRLRDQRIRHGRKVVFQPALFPGYAFVLIPDNEPRVVRLVAGYSQIIER